MIKGRYNVFNLYKHYKYILYIIQNFITFIIVLIIFTGNISHQWSPVVLANASISLRIFNR